MVVDINVGLKLDCKIDQDNVQRKIKCDLNYVGGILFEESMTRVE
jgi:hypothetical protein